MGLPLLSLCTLLATTFEWSSVQRYYSLDCRAVRSCLLHLSSPHTNPQHRIHYRHVAFPTVIWCHPKCPLSNSVLKSQNSEHLPPLHIPTCVRREQISRTRCPRQAHAVLVEMLCRPIVVSELAGIPLQPPTVVSTCPAHVFHPDASSV